MTLQVHRFPRTNAVGNRHERVSVGFDVALLFAAIAGAMIVIFRESIFPPRFFYDGNHIQQIAAGTSSAFGDASYGNVAELYKILGLSNNPLAASLLGYLLFLAIVLFARQRIVKPSPIATLLVILIVILGAVYLGFYSKDVMVLPVVALVIGSPGEWARRQFLIVAAMVTYALLFRSYWILVAILYVAFQFLRLDRRSVRTIAIVLVASSAASGAALYLLLGVPADYFRSAVNASRDLSFDATSVIHPFIAVGEPISGIINSVLTSATLLVPIPLALLLTPYYLFLSAAIVFLWFSYFSGARVYRKVAETDQVVTSSIVLLAAFVVVQGLFEPDYGSALRHLTPLLPLLLVVSARPFGGGATLNSHLRVPHR